MELKKDTGMLCPTSYNTGAPCHGCAQCAPVEAQPALSIPTFTRAQLDHIARMAVDWADGRQPEYGGYALHNFATAVRLMPAADDQAQPVASDDNSPAVTKAIERFHAKLAEHQTALAATQPAVAPADLRTAILEVLVNRANNLTEQLLMIERQKGDAKRPVNALLDELLGAVTAALAARKPAADKSEWPAEARAEFAEVMQQMRAYLAAGVPDGYWLAPVELNDVMATLCDESVGDTITDGRSFLRVLWAELRATAFTAAPSAPAAPVQTVPESVILKILLQGADEGRPMVFHKGRWYGGSNGVGFDLLHLLNTLAAQPMQPTDGPSTLGQQVAAAQAEVATWSDEQRASVRLEGDVSQPADGKDGA